jgi:hypothetical protein
MNEDRDTRDREGGATTTVQRTESGSGGAGDVWARAAEQAREDMARAQRHAAARENGAGKNRIP